MTAPHVTPLLVMAVALVLAAPASARAQSATPTVAVTDTLHCARVECRCSGPPTQAEEEIYFSASVSQWCTEVRCRCRSSVGNEPGGASLLTPPAVPLELVNRPHAPVYGAHLVGRTAALSLELGFPFILLHVGFAVHDRVELGVGYRTFIGTTHGAYGSMRVRLYDSPLGNGHLSLGVLGGYNAVPDAGINHGLRTALSAGNSWFGEAHLSLSLGPRGHAFIADIGARLGWVGEPRPCSDWDCYRIFGGDPGLLVTPFFEVGYSVRLGERFSMYFAAGGEVYVLSAALVGSPRGRFGFVFDI